MFGEDERRIFTYEGAAGKVVRADPLVLRRRLLQASAGEFYDLLAGSYKPAGAGKEPLEVVMAREEAQEKAVLCVRAAFDLPAIDPETGSGCTEAMCWKVLTDFMDLMEGEKKPAGQ